MEHPLTDKDVQNLMPGTKLLCIEAGSGVVQGKFYLFHEIYNSQCICVMEAEEKTYKVAFSRRFSLLPEKPITPEEKALAKPLPDPEEALKFMTRDR